MQAQATELPAGGGMGVLNPALQGLQGFSLGQDATSTSGVGLSGVGGMEDPAGINSGLGGANTGLGSSIGMAGVFQGSGAGGGYNMFSPNGQSSLEGAALTAAAVDPPGLTFGGTAAAAGGAGSGGAAFMFPDTVAKPSNGVDHQRQLGLGSGFALPGRLGGLPDAGVPGAGAPAGSVLSGMGFQNGVGAALDAASGLASFNHIALQNSSASQFY
jgi:hypothetical protein